MLFKLSNIWTVPLLATVILSTVDKTESKQAKQLPNALENVLRKYGKQSNNFDIKDALRAKVAKLVPFLDDNKHDIKVKERLALRDVQDKKNMRNIKLNPVNKKYRKLRKEIQKLLKIEAVSEDTKRAVTNALDQITADLMSNECLWKKKAVDDEKPMTTDQTELVNHIKQKWNKIVHQYSIKYIGSNETARKAFALLTGLRKFVFDVHEEYKKLESRYATKCDLVDKFNKQEVVKSLEENELSNCDMICSIELLNFMTNFYEHLKDTYSDVFNNYIHMYYKEINPDDADLTLKNHVNKIRQHVDKKINLCFNDRCELHTFTKNHTLSKIDSDSIMDFVDSILESTMKIIEESMQIKLKDLSPKLRMTVRDDLHTTASIELGNLRQDLKNSICTAFRTCNSIMSRKYLERDYDSPDPNSIHLNLKLKFDKKLLKQAREVFNGRKMNSIFSGLEKTVHKLESNKDNLTESQNGYKVSKMTNFDDLLNATKTIGGNSKKVHIGNDIPFDINKYEHVNVTRTTLNRYIERGTTKVT